MIATISKSFTFDAAHRLNQLPPTHKCYRTHGHTYRVEVVLRGPVGADGFVLDYANIAKAWAPLNDDLDHRCLNDVEGLSVPSAENLAAWIVERLRRSLPMLEHVRVYESSTTWCEVSPW